MSNWLITLTKHYDIAALEDPANHKLLLLDIDGTILDIRAAIYHLLKQYDIAHQREFFHKLAPSLMQHAGASIHDVMKKLGISKKIQSAVAQWVDQSFYSQIDLHQQLPMQKGAFELIRWFQMQPMTCVALISGRRQQQLDHLLTMLNRLSAPYGVQFSADMLHLRPDEWPDSVAAHKVACVRKLQKSGYQIVAMLDSEPANLAAVAGADDLQPFFLMHSDTVSLSNPDLLPNHMQEITLYERITQVARRELPPDTQLVWRSIKTRDELKSYLASDIEWAELDVYADSAGKHFSMQPAPIPKTAAEAKGKGIALDEALHMLKAMDRSVQISLHMPPAAFPLFLAQIEQHQFEPDKLCFSMAPEHLNADSTRLLLHAYPNTTLQCPIDSWGTAADSPATLRLRLNRAASLGINRFSLTSGHPNLQAICMLLTTHGFQFNIHSVNDRHSLWQALPLEPRSITGDFRSLLDLELTPSVPWRQARS